MRQLLQVWFLGSVESDRSQPFEFRLRQVSGRLSGITSSSLEDFLQLGDLRLRDQHAVLAVSLRVVTELPRLVFEWAAQDIELVVEGCLPLATPSPKCRAVNSSELPGCIRHGQVFGAVSGDIRGDIFHAGDSAQNTPESNSDLVAACMSALNHPCSQADGFFD